MIYWIIGILIYCIISGITYKLVEEYSDLNGDGAIVLSGMFWPFALPAFLGATVVEKIASKIRSKEQSKEIIISNLKQDVVKAEATRFKIKNENDFERANKACAGWRLTNPLVSPHR
jgi:hypothetical protein